MRWRHDIVGLRWEARSMRGRTGRPATRRNIRSLAAVHGIITQAGGYAQIYSEPGMGTTVTTLLPITSQAADTAPPSAAVTVSWSSWPKARKA